MADEVANPLYAVIDQFSAEYGDIIRPLIDEISQKIIAGEPPADAVKQVFAEHGVQPSIRDAVLDSMVRAAAIGYGIPEKEIKDPIGMRKAMLEKTWPTDEVNFSEKVIRGEVRQVVIDEIRAGLAQANSFQQIAAGLSDPLRIGGGPDFVSSEAAQYIDRVVQAAKRVAGGDTQALREYRSALAAARQQVARLAANSAPTQTLKAIYEDVLAATETFKVSLIEATVSQALRDKARYYAERIARTEIARAYGYSFQLENVEDEFTVGVHFLLSTRHPHACICNFWTTVDMYGMGPGVFPKATAPAYPFHPHCLCVQEKVYQGEAIPRMRSDESGQKTLMAMTREERQSVMGVKNSEDFLKKPYNWKDQLPQYRDPKTFQKDYLTREDFEGKV